MSEDVVFELAPLSVQFFVNLRPRIAELDADGLSVQDGDLLHKFAGDGVIVCGEFRFPPLNKFPQAVHPGRLASLPLIFLKSLYGKACHLKMSRGILFKGAARITEGPLKGMENRICKVDRHKRLAHIRTVIGSGGELSYIQVGLEITEKYR